MKILWTVLFASTFTTTAFANEECYKKAFAAGKAVLELNANGQPTELSQDELGLVLGEKSGYAIAMTGMIGQKPKQIRVDFASSETCEIKSIQFKSRGW